MQLDIEALLTTLTQLATLWGLKVLGALAVLILGLAAARWIRSGLRKALSRSKMDDTLVPFLSDLVYYLALAFVVVSVLGLFGIPTASLVAVVGAAGLAVGLALQGTLSNFAAGVMLLVFRPFRVGDYVEIGGSAGSVQAVTVFTSTLNTPDNIRVIVPNSKVWGEVIKNYTANPTRRCDLVIGISYGDDIERALAAIREVLADEPRVLPEPEPVLAVGELADSSVNVLVRPWCRKEDYWPLRWTLTRQLKEKLEAGGCSIPYPQRDVHLHRAENRRREERASDSAAPS